ncbi:hypothetical protein ECP03047774_5269, partial [Escherichia coli P0304777.4]
MDIGNYCTFYAQNLILMYAYISINMLTVTSGRMYAT